MFENARLGVQKLTLLKGQTTFTVGVIQGHWEDISVINWFILCLFVYCKKKKKYPDWAITLVGVYM